jgi:uncharacterized OB-fold protein
MNDRLLPQIDDDAPFWEAAADHELRMQQCGECGRIWWPPGPVCPSCWSRDHEWVELSGRGEINTWVVFHRAYFEEFEDRVPYNVAEIELEEGPRYLANVVGCENDDLYRGMPVEVVFEDVTDEVTLPKFRPRE